MALPYRSKALAIALTAMFNCSMTAHAAPNTSAPKIDVPPIVQNTLRDGDEVVHQFQDGALRGWVVKPAGMRPVIAYTANNDEILIYGDAVRYVDSHYVRIHEKELLPYLAEAQTSAQEAWERAKDLTGFSEGASDEKAKHHLYVFFDPSCVFCHYAYLALRPYVEQTESVQVKWIPVVVLGSQSIKKAAALIESDRPLAIMKAVNDEWNETHGDSFPVKENIPDELMAKIEANTQFLREIGSESTPTFLFKDADGNPDVIKGMPRLAQFAKWFHTKKLPNSNERLERFE